MAKSISIPSDHPLATVPPEDLAAFGYAVAKLIAGVWRRERAERPALKAAS
jgi:hypothetical protein